MFYVHVHVNGENVNANGCFEQVCESVNAIYG